MRRSIFAALLSTLSFAAYADQTNGTGCPTTPSWATCNGTPTLQVHAGWNWGAIAFENVTWSSTYFGAATFPLQSPLSVGGACTTHDYLLYDTTVDGYDGNTVGTGYCPNSGGSSTCGTDDGIHVAWGGGGSNTRIGHVYIRNTTSKNIARPTSASHTDNWQTLGSPQMGGWMVIQDSIFRNADDENMQMDASGCDNDGGCSSSHGGVLIQNLLNGNSAGFQSDNNTGRYTGAGGTLQLGGVGCGNSDYAIWLVNVQDGGGYTSAGATLYATGGAPYILVGTNQTFGLGGGASAYDGKRYVFTTIEAALAATACSDLAAGDKPDGCLDADFPLVVPPFIGRSSSGWSGSDPPDCVDGVDNDSDGNIDSADSACTTALTESEGGSPSGSSITGGSLRPGGTLRWH